MTESYSSHLLLSDDEIRALGIRECDLEVYRRRRYTSAFAIDTWYNHLKHLSFKTSSLVLSYQQAQDILHFHSLKRLSTSLVATHNYTKDTNICNLVFSDSLLQLERDLDELIKREYSNGCFVKLNTRSPKDVPLYDYGSKVMEKTIIEEISKLKPSERTRNNETIAFIKACSNSLKVENGRRAVELLILSDRVAADLSRDVQFGEKHFDMKLIVREWLNEMYEKPQMEFRCFVHKTKLNAITQYFSVVHFPELVEKKEEILNRMINFFRDEVQPNLTQSSYVVDLFVSTNRIYIIELNPFHNGAGGGLFSWSKNRDLFMNGPLEFRIVNSEKELDEDPWEFITTYWLRLIKSHFHPNEEEGEEEERSLLPSLLIGSILLLSIFSNKFIKN
eukprot:TRINITY_DN3076_c0_g1_i1.p1 TRINITY_DN3076_c0_g1~~TRINITY_DN3076_c0_g1_i1.p1  ORF type:complete len:391 (-),score=115.60 TRINITY_DN3076_c0_g1_i1:602-1774(-)